ncbi:MAG: LCP family protein [Acidimicrobiales bacterium]
MPRVRGRRHRRLSERVLLAVIAGLAALTGMAGLAMGYVVWSLGRVERLDVASALVAAEDAPVTASDIVAGNESTASSGTLSLAGAATVDESGDGFDQLTIHRSDRPAENYLIVGSDSVEGVDASDAVLTGREEQTENHLADTIMILRLEPDGTAAVVSVPRDLLVTIAGTNRTALVNSAFNLEDRAERAVRLISTVQESLDIELQHFVEIDLDGFRRVVDAVGGVQVCFDQATRDRNVEDSGNPNRGGTGFVATAGLNHLDGDEALAFVRSRHLLVSADGVTWDRLGFWNDQERSARQQQFIVEVVDQTFSAAVSSPNTVRRLLDVVADNLATSNTISLFDDGLDLAQLFSDFGSSKLERYGFEVYDNQVRGIQGLSLIENSTNSRILEVFNGVGWDDVVESRVSVTVTGTESALTAADLREIGFDAGRGSGASEVVGSGAPVIRYGIGGQLAAVVLASHMSPQVELVGDQSLAGNNLALEIGDGTPLISADFRAVSLPTEVSIPPEAAEGVVAAGPPAAFAPVAEGICG